MIKNILLQCKFFLVEFLNVTYPLIPNPLRNFYLRMYGIRVWGGTSCIHRGCKFFHVGKMNVGRTLLSILVATLTIDVVSMLETMSE